MVFDLECLTTILAKSGRRIPHLQVLFCNRFHFFTRFGFQVPVLPDDAIQKAAELNCGKFHRLAQKDDAVLFLL
jgi:hypothetical protein